MKKTRQSLRLFFFIEEEQHAKSKRVLASLNTSQNDSLLFAQRFENDLKQNQTRNHDFRHQRNNRTSFVAISKLKIHDKCALNQRTNVEHIDNIKRF